MSQFQQAGGQQLEQTLKESKITNPNNVRIHLHYLEDPLGSRSWRNLGGGGGGGGGGGAKL